MPEQGSPDRLPDPIDFSNPLTRVGSTIQTISKPGKMFLCVKGCVLLNANFPL